MKTMIKFLGWWLVAMLLMVIISLLSIGITVLTDMVRQLPEVWRAILFFGSSSFLLAAFGQALWSTRR